MGQYFRVNGDYNIKSKDGGTIVLDPGASGLVYIPGNLTVAGATTSISTTNTDIEDNIITLNKGETSTGVSLRYSGMEIDRGSSSRAALVFDESNPTGIAGSVGTWIIASATTPGTTYAFGDSNLKLKRILTDAGEDSGDLTLIGTGGGVVKVRDEGGDGTAYFGNIADPNHVPNKYYVDYSILNNPTFQIRAPSQDTRVIIADKELGIVSAGSFVIGRRYLIRSIGSTNFTAIGSIINSVGTLFTASGPGTGDGTAFDATVGGSLGYYKDQTGYNVAEDNYSESGVGFVVDSILTATFYQNRVQLQDLEIIGSEIRHDNSNENIYINTNGTGKLQTNYAIQLDNNAVSPAIVTGSHVIYSKPESIGKSGIFFVNTENNRDELVSKNRALLFSMLF